MIAKYELHAKRALVTGSASGIGLATVKRLAANGCRVALNYLPGDQRGPQEVARLTDAGLDVVGIAAAVGDRQEDELVQAALDHLGGLDLLVNNAGTPGGNATIPAASLDLVTDTLWSTVLDVNLIGLFRVTLAAAPHLRQASGAVVNLASISAFTSRGSSMAYAASKAGVATLTRHLAQALAPEVRVNAVAPGAVDSPWQIAWTAEQRRAQIDATPLRKLCSPEEIAETIVYLGFCAPMITGQCVVIDGGMTL